MSRHVVPARPYPGLRPFQKHEWSIFFGREPMIDAVLDRLAQTRLVVVHGSSGCGKSSLVKAGVLPRLEQEHSLHGVSWRTAQMRPGSSVAAVGNAAGIKLETTVIPFLLRGINLLGIDFVSGPHARRVAAWDRITRDLPLDLLEALTEDAVLADVPRLGNEILKGRVRGRVVVDVRG